MTDCPNAEIRDRLPDLLHERLDASTRAVVMAHVAACAECRAELALLREASLALSASVRSVNVDAIAREVVARTAPTVARPLRRRTWVDWRLAAAVAFVALGGASFVALREGAVRQQQPIVVTTDSAAIPPVVVTPQTGATTTVASRPVLPQPAKVVAQNAEGLSAGGGVSDLSDADLKALLNDLEKMDAVPLIEPEPVTVRVVPGRGSSE